jgi:hypothetical protein
MKGHLLAHRQRRCVVVDTKRKQRHAWRMAGRKRQDWTGIISLTAHAPARHVHSEHILHRLADEIPLCVVHTKTTQHVQRAFFFNELGDSLTVFLPNPRATSVSARTKT